MKIITKQKKSGWQLVNAVIFYLHIVFPFWLMAWMYTCAFSTVLLPVAVTAALALGAVYKLVKKFQKGKGILIAARVIVIGICIAFYLPTVVLMNFKHTKLLYPIKRADYIYGVYGSAEYYGKLLPEKLPEVCEDYSFITMGSMIAQDYHASSYLIFCTDTATLDAYAAYYGAMDSICIENDPDYDPEYNWEADPDYGRKQGDIDWFCGQMRLGDDYRNNLDHAVLYWFNAYYPKGVLLDYDTGLVAILT